MPEARPTVAVIIPTHNRCAFLAECLDSLLAQTLPPAQLIVVNDGSTDDTVSALHPYTDRIRYLETANVGKATAINLALEVVDSEYLWIFDDDDVAVPDALERFVAPLVERPELGFSYSSFYVAESDPVTGRIGEASGEMAIPEDADKHFLLALLDHNFVGGAAVFARSACYEKTGPFQPELVRSQDYDMAIRLARVARGIRVQGEPTFFYRQHPGARGSQQDSFSVNQRFLKWLEYDQIIFRRLYREMSLEEYLPEGVDLLDGHRREAHLRRLLTVASKLLVDESVEEIHHLAALPPEDGGPLTAEELKLIRRLVHRRPWYGGGWIFDQPAFTAAIRANRGAPAVSAVREEFRRTMLSMALGECLSHLRGAAGLTRRCARMYLG